MSIMNEAITFLAYVFLVCGAVIVTSAILLLAVYCLNRLQHALVDHYGGWQTFLRYRKWYYEEVHLKNKQKP